MGAGQLPPCAVLVSTEHTEASPRPLSRLVTPRTLARCQSTGLGLRFQNETAAFVHASHRSHSSGGGVHGAGGQNQEARQSDPRLRKSKKKVNWNISGRFLSRMVLRKNASEIDGSTSDIWVEDRPRQFPSPS